MSPTHSPKQTPWTPGPWTKVRGELVGANGAKVVEYGSGVAIMCGGPDPESVANAAIRNAAPELYEALEKIRDLTAPGQELGISDAIDLICDVWNISSAALSKARPSNRGEG